MHGIFQQESPFIDEPEIHAPGVHADAVRLPVSLGLFDPGFQLLEKAQKIPEHGTPQVHRFVDEPVYLAGPDAGAVVFAQHDPSAGRPVIRCQYLFFHLLLPYFLYRGPKFAQAR